MEFHSTPVEAASAYQAWFQLSFWGRNACSGRYQWIRNINADAPMLRWGLFKLSCRLGTARYDICQVINHEICRSLHMYRCRNTTAMARQLPSPALAWLKVSPVTSWEGRRTDCQKVSDTRRQPGSRNSGLPATYRYVKISLQYFLNGKEVVAEKSSVRGSENISFCAVQKGPAASSVMLEALRNHFETRGGNRGDVAYIPQSFFF